MGGDQAHLHTQGPVESAHLCPECLPGLHPSPPLGTPKHTQMHMHTCTQEHTCIHGHTCTRTRMGTHSHSQTCTHTDTPAHTLDVCTPTQHRDLPRQVTEGHWVAHKIQRTGISDAPQVPTGRGRPHEQGGTRQAGWGCAQVLGFQNPHGTPRGLRFSNINLSRASTLDSLEGTSVVTGQWVPSREAVREHSGTGEPSLLRWPREPRLQGVGGLGGRRRVIWTGGSCGQQPGVRQTQTLPPSEASSLLTRSANASGLHLPQSARL